MTREGLLVSVVLPVKNGERFLASAIHSVVNSDYRPLEIVLVDGRSSDRTAEIAQSFEQVRYICQINQGIADAYNVGIDHAKGEIVAFISHDDVWTSNKLSVQVEHLLSHPEIQYSVCRFEYLLEHGCPIPRGFKERLLGKDHVGYILETLVARKSLFNLIGKFNTDYAIAMDVDWYARARHLNVPMAVMPDILLYKRVHDRNSSTNAQANNQELLKILKQSVDRRRQEYSSALERVRGGSPDGT